MEFLTLSAIYQINSLMRYVTKYHVYVAGNKYNLKTLLFTLILRQGIR